MVFLENNLHFCCINLVVDFCWFLQFIGNYQETSGVKTGWGAGELILSFWLLTCFKEFRIDQTLNFLYLSGCFTNAMYLKVYDARLLLIKLGVINNKMGYILACSKKKLFSHYGLFNYMWPMLHLCLWSLLFGIIPTSWFELTWLN